MEKQRIPNHNITSEQRGIDFSAAYTALKIIGLFLIYSAFVYLMIAFYRVEIDFRKWDENLRLCMALFGFLFGGLISVLIVVNQEDK